MLRDKPHTEEAYFDTRVGKRLLAEQFPELASLTFAAASAGTDHFIYRLGPSLALRIPRTKSASLQVFKEQRWLRILAPCLSVEIPEPVAMGEPSQYYPYHWSIYRWISGQVSQAEMPEREDNAFILARFISELRSCDPSLGPTPGRHNFGRGASLAPRSERTERAIDSILDWEARAKARYIWKSAVSQPAESTVQCWLHGDLQVGNLITTPDGRVKAVIDFGGLAVGDAACDLMAAWTVLDRHSRRPFRDAINATDEAWTRGKAWALTTALLAFQYYKGKSSTMERQSQRTLQEVLEAPFASDY